LVEGGQGFALEYPQISLHAISKDLTHFPDECLYLMVDVNDTLASGSESGELMIHLIMI
jgi:Regulator of volume decrease after cellular swelling